MRWVGVRQEVRDNGRLDDDLAVVRECRDQASRVDLQVLRCARGVKVDDDFFKGNLELLQDDVSPVCPWASVVGVQDELGVGRTHFVYIL